MKTTEAKRVEIVIEAPLLRRLTDVLDAAGVSGYTVLPVLAGSGRSGSWTREGEVGYASGMAAVICIVSPGKANDMLEAAFSVVERHIGVVSVADCQVVRAERF